MSRMLLDKWKKITKKQKHTKGRMGNLERMGSTKKESEANGGERQKRKN